MAQRHRETTQFFPSYEGATNPGHGHGVTEQTGPRLSLYSGYQWFGENDHHGLNLQRFQDGRNLDAQPPSRTKQRHVETMGVEPAPSRKATLSASSPDDASGGTRESFTTHSPSFTDSVSGTDATASSTYLTTSDTSEASTSQLIPHKSHQDSRPGEAGRSRLPWSSCAPAVAILAFAAILLMSAVSTMAGTNRLLFSFPINRVRELPPLEEFPVDAGQKGNSSTKTEESTEGRWNKFFAGDRRHKTAATPVFEILEANAKTSTAANDWTRKAKVRRPPMRTVRRSRNTRKHPTDNFVKVDAEAATEDLMSFPSSHPKRPMCGAVFYSYCNRRPRRQFHFLRAANACIEAEADALHLCNRGANRFASMRHCRQSCVSAKRPQGACFDEPLFTSCARQDVLSSWWHLRGKKCVPWSFPSGGCPASGSDVFRTVQECEKHCKGPRPRRWCRRPRVVSCTTSHLKYPFFAHTPPEGGPLRCLRSSIEALQEHRCLTGANRFHSLEACLVSCWNRPHV
ncbi:uncharacterized protein LOC144097131 [Amblyomma americanum]